MRNIRFLTLEVRASNVPAIRLYRGYGYGEVGRRLIITAGRRRTPSC